MNKPEHIKQLVARALVAAVGGGVLVGASAAHAEPPIKLEAVKATMSLQEHIEWLRKGGPRFCEMIPDFLDYGWQEQVIPAQQVAVQAKVGG